MIHLKYDYYRPISLVAAISKVFEKAAFIQLYEYFNMYVDFVINILRKCYH